MVSLRPLTKSFGSQLSVGFSISRTTKGCYPQGAASQFRYQISVRHKSSQFGYTQAKALVFSEHGEPKEVLKLHTYSISPSLPDNHVLLRTIAAPINPADVNIVQGKYGARAPFSQLLGTPHPAAVGGNEGVFEVVSTGTMASTGSPKAPQLQKGDWVIPVKSMFGTWRTHAAVPADAVMRIDKTGIEPIQAGICSINPLSAYRMLSDFVKKPPMREGDWFIQNGANSGVGRAAIQLSKLWGYNSINVVRARPTVEHTMAIKNELLALGATKVVTEQEMSGYKIGKEAFREQIKQWTGGRPEGVRLGLNCVGGKSALLVAGALGHGGKLVTYGAMAQQPLRIPTGMLVFKNLSCVGFWLSRWADEDREGKERTVHEVLKLIREGKFKDMPTVKIPWEWETMENELTEQVQTTLSGFRDGKGVFVFGDT